MALIHPQFDPVAVSLGPVAVHWYGLMYLLGFVCFWWLGRMRAKESWRGLTPDDVENLLFYGVFGVILGGRLGYCLFYQPGYYLAEPLRILEVWQGGMSAHGGLLGVVIVMLIYARRQGLTFWQIADFVSPIVPLGLFFGRIGNFINGELWGRAAGSDVPWAMIFKNSGTLVPRHPSQLYEAFLEGALLFTVLWWFSSKPRVAGAVGSLFCMGYGLVRFIVEYFREPDSYLGLGLFGLSRGQWLSLPVFLLGLVVWIWVHRRKSAEN